MDSDDDDELPQVGRGPSHDHVESVRQVNIKKCRPISVCNIAITI